MTTLSSRCIAGPGFDALAHAIESFLSVRANPFSKLYSRQAILWLSEGLPKVQASPSDLETWERVALGSTFAGIAIGNAGCTAPHGIEHPISGLLNVAHGEGLAAIYPEYMRFMPSWPGFWARRLPALRKRKPRCAPSSRWTPF